MRPSSCPSRIALVASTLLFVVPAIADEPKEPLNTVEATAPPLSTPTTAPDLIAQALAPQPGGLTPNEVGRMALHEAPSLKLKGAELRAAAAKVSQALLSFVPRVSGAASYTRLSSVQNSLGTQTVFGNFTEDGKTFTPGITQGPLLTAPCGSAVPPLPGVGCVRDAGQNWVGMVQVPFNFPVLLNAYSLTAQLTVPVSDYVLRLSHGYAAASHTESAKRLAMQAEALKIAADAKVAFLGWVQAKAATVVAGESVKAVDAHLDDVRRLFAAGLSSKADVLGLEAQQANAEQGRIAAVVAADFTEQNLRILTGLPLDKPVSIGIDVLNQPTAPTTETLSALQDEALAHRLDIRALDETEHSLKSLVSLARAAYLPRIDAVANVTYANPNQRFFPQSDEFNLTWDAGVRLSWTLNDTLAAPATVAEAKAQVELINAQKQQIVQGLKLEVASAYGDLKKAEASIESSNRGLTSAEEALRVRSELFKAGRATSVEILDAENAVTVARLNRVSARVGILVAKTKLDHAVGRDVPKS